MELFKTSYGVWKTVYQNHSSSWAAYEVRDGLENRELWTGNADFVFTSRVDGSTFTDYSSSIMSSVTTVSQSDDAKALIVGLEKIPNIRTSDGIPLSAPPARQSADNATLVAMVGREGTEKISATHNLCDPTTWYTGSVRVTENLSGSSGDTVFSGSYPNWIDLRHGRVLGEHLFSEAYDVIVTVDGVTQSMRAPYASSGGDYQVLYSSGAVEFFSPVTGTVEAIYSYSKHSHWTLEPDPGEAIDIEQAEIQFSKDAIINDTINMEVWGYVQVFAPQLWVGMGGPYPTNTRIQLEVSPYMRFEQFIDEALGSYPVIPPVGGPTRGITSEVYGFPFNYNAVRRLWSKYGMQLRVCLANDKAVNGERATATFYMTSRPESNLE